MVRNTGTGPCVTPELIILFPQLFDLTAPHYLTIPHMLPASCIPLSNCRQCFSWHPFPLNSPKSKIFVVVAFHADHLAPPVFVYTCSLSKGSIYTSADSLCVLHANTLQQPQMSRWQIAPMMLMLGVDERQKTINPNYQFVSDCQFKLQVCYSSSFF